MNARPRWTMWVVTFLIVLVPSAGMLGATFDVFTVPQLENALAVAVANGEDDVINLEAGYYALDSTLSYRAPLSENKALTIQCRSRDAVIDAGWIYSVRRGLYITTSGAASHVTLDGLTIQNGFVDSLGESGAAMYVWLQRGGITLKNCVIRNNSAKLLLGSPIDTAGAWLRIDNSPSMLTVSNCVFTNNYASGYAGGLYMGVGGGASGRVVNCVFAGNTAAYRGGGAWVNVVGGSVLVDNNTFVSNRTGNGNNEGGGGLSLRLYSESDSAIVRNNIIWGNTSNTGLGSDMHVEDDGNGNTTGAVVSVFNNDIADFDIQDGDHLAQGANTNANPLLTSDYHLRAASPCIDAGTNLSWMSGATDVDGQPRVFNGRVDMGMDEATVSAVSFSCAGTVTSVWDTVVDAKCQLQYRTNLLSGSWQDVGNMATATSRRITMIDTNRQGPMRLYSLRWTRP